MESLAEFTERTWQFQVDSVPDEPTFGLPASLSEKVTPGTGALAPFHGLTVAHLLDDRAGELVGHTCELLHAALGASLSQPLPVDMAHVTLHDLHADARLHRVEPLVEASVDRAAALVVDARAIGTIETTCTAAFNLMNTSVVLGLRAIDDAQHRKLLIARALFDQVVPGGPFTPHITLAYYRPGSARPVAPDELRVALGALTRECAGAPIRLDPGRLYALRFDSMARYWSVAPLRRGSVRTRTRVRR